MRIGLLIDRANVSRWQADALRQLTGEHRLYVYSSTNSFASRRLARHWPYYLLSLVSLRSEQTRRTALPPLAIAGTVNFEYLREAGWHRLPDSLIERLTADRIDVIVKFGHELLRVPPQDHLPIPILSYHHGDPRRFRGRPAGFYELLSGRRTVGQIIQILSNRLDAGSVVAFAETRVHPHSYRATMREAYAISPLLLPKALKAVCDGQTLDLKPEGAVTRLPSLWTVMRFASQRLSAKLRRLAYGAFIEKRWQVATAPAPDSDCRGLMVFPPSATWCVVDRPSEYRFLADPFPHPTHQGMLVEALRGSNGLGEIVHMSTTGPRTIMRGGGHFSYPASIVTSEGAFLVPEVCEWSEPLLYRIDAEGLTPAGHLKLDRQARLIDPTLHQLGSELYLFANIFGEGGSVLRLWRSASLHDQFTEHPASPILISPKGARMGGLLFQSDGALYRVGQDGSRAYGDGMLLFRVETMSSTAYREILVDELHFDHCHGPHTLNWGSSGLLFDYYHDQFHLLAGVRRLKGRLARRA